MSAYAKNQDQTLEQTIIDLYLAVLTAFYHILRYFADSSFRELPFSPGDRVRTPTYMFNSSVFKEKSR